jgi:hypothetical protein
MALTHPMEVHDNILEVFPRDNTVAHPSNPKSIPNTHASSRLLLNRQRLITIEIHEHSYVKVDTACSGVRWIYVYDKPMKRCAWPGSPTH